jgi:hypothetical protein
MILPGGKPLVIGVNSEPRDAPLADVKASAPLAAVDRQLIAFTDTAGRSLPEFQGDAMPVSSAAISIEDLAAFRISTRKNQWISRHPVIPSRSITTDLMGHLPERANLAR